MPEQITADLSEAIHVGARPLTVPQWWDLLMAEGFRIVGQMRAPMHLLEPRRLIADEGWRGTARIVGRIARDPGGPAARHGHAPGVPPPPHPHCRGRTDRRSSTRTPNG